MKYTYHHAVVFILTFSSYAFFHATRKTFSNVKTTISNEWTPSKPQCLNSTCMPNDLWNGHHMYTTSDEEYLGVLDAAFMIAYAVGLFISGMLGDRFDLRKVLAFGMCSSAVCVFIFGTLCEWLTYYNRYLYVAIWIMNGLLQSTGWPAVVAVMGNWFGRSSRGLVLGLWSACASVGNIIGAVMVSSVLDYGYDYAFLLPSALLFAGGVINFFALVPSPKEIGLPVPDEDPDLHIKDTETVVSHVQDSSDRSPLLQSDSEDEVHNVPSETKRPPAVGFLQAVRLPGVLLYALAYACLKLVNYSFFFWLPYYLTTALKWDESVADKVSIWYDVGGIIGGTIAGFISDRIEKRSVIVIPMLILAIPSLFIYSHSPKNLTINGVLMAVVGFFIGGVANLISAAISADLGRQGPIAGNAEALSTVTGIIDGTGSVGAAIGQLIVPAIQNYYDKNWVPVFVFFMIMTAMTGVCISPLVVSEAKSFFRNCSWFGGYRTRQDDLEDVPEENQGLLDNN